MKALLIIFLILGMMSCTSDPVKLKVTYLDNSTEVIVTEDHFWNIRYITKVRNGCTVHIWDKSRCGVKKVEIVGS
jgi:hypothetical protein